MASVPRRTALPVLASVALLWVGCGEAPTNPLVVEVVPPPPAYDVAGGGGTEGDVSLPVPATNLISYGSVTPFHVFDYQANDFVYVRVSGSVSTTPLSCPGAGATGTFGPWGHPANGSFEVRIVGPTGHALSKDPSTQGTSVMVAREVASAPGSVLVGRTGGGSTCLEWDGEKYVNLAGLAIGGAQNVHYEAYPVGAVSAAPTYVVTGGATFMSLESHWDIDEPVWVYQLGDTLAPRGPRWGKEACRGDLSCIYAPERSGRVYLTGKIYGADVQVWGPIVWVRDSVPNACTLPPSGVAGAPMKADGPYAGPPCPPPPDSVPDPPEEEEPLTVELDCGPSPVDRGQEVLCQASVGPEDVDPAEVTFHWVFQPDPGMAELAELPALEPVTEDGLGLNPWKGTAAQPGGVSVTVERGPESASATARLEVAARTWEWKFPYPQERPPVRKVLVDDAGDPMVLEEPAYFDAQQGVDVWPKGGGGRYKFTVRAAGLLEPVGEGPNRGYAYVAGYPGVVSWLPPEIYISPGLYPGHPFYEAQRGGSIRDILGSAYNHYCSKKEMDDILQGILEHEGAVPAPNSHHDATVDFYNHRYDIGPLVERAVVQVPPKTDPGYVQRFSTARSVILKLLVTDPGDAYNDSVVHANLPTVRCKLRYPSNSGGGL